MVETKNRPSTSVLYAAWAFCLLILVIFSYGALWGSLGALALPGQNFFAMFILFTTSFILGQLMVPLRLPSLLGMLIMGFILRNTPKISVAKNVDPDWASVLRRMALAIILLRAGVNMDANILNKIKAVCLRLAVIPCVVESVVAAVLAFFLLKFDWYWSLMLGFVVGSVSPAVVIPSMLVVQGKQLGTEKGVPTLIMASGSLDNVVAIACFGVVYGLKFSTGNLAWTIAQGPVGIIIGIVFGLVIGVLLWHVPVPGEEHVSAYRSLILLAAGMCIMLAANAFNLYSAGVMGCIVAAYTAALRWRRDNQVTPVASVFRVLWLIFEPILFGLIGSNVEIANLNKDTVGLGLAIIFGALLVRSVVTYFVVCGVNFNRKEKAFASISWIPKATVQAAIGPMALDYATSIHNDDYMKLGLQVLTIAVLSIIVTAPVGAVAILFSAPKLLKKEDDGSVDRDSLYSVDLRLNEIVDHL